MTIYAQNRKKKKSVPQGSKSGGTDRRTDRHEKLGGESLFKRAFLWKDIFFYPATAEHKRSVWAQKCFFFKSEDTA